MKKLSVLCSLLSFALGITNSKTIAVVIQNKGSYCISYFALLKNGSRMGADYFFDGPFKGQYSAKRYEKNHVIRLENPECDYMRLKKLYEKSSGCSLAPSIS